MRLAMRRRSKQHQGAESSAYSTGSRTSGHETPHNTNPKPSPRVVRARPPGRLSPRETAPADSQVGNRCRGIASATPRVHAARAARARCKRKVSSPQSGHDSFPPARTKRFTLPRGRNHDHPFCLRFFSRGSGNSIPRRSVRGQNSARPSRRVQCKGEARRGLPRSWLRRTVRT